MYTILIVDDEANLLEVLAVALENMGYGTVTAETAEEALAVLEEREVHLVLSDLRLPGLSGRELMEKVKAANPDLPVVIMTAYASLKEAVEIIKEGAFDYTVKPFELDALEATIASALRYYALGRDNRDLREQLQTASAGQFVGQSPAYLALLRNVREVSASSANVLITGESGTGKEVVAKAIHYGGPRAKAPLVTINCAAIPEQLLESELFGHARGAFTGATSNRKGRFAQADGGTLFLDEIGDMPLALQAKILRCIQEKAIEPVGSNTTQKVDVRIIAATNQNLVEAIEKGKFRRDLYYRLNVYPIIMPSLRERKEDIPLLAEHFALRAAGEMGKVPVTFTEAALEILKNHTWPGNIRELENCIERLTIIASGTAITPERLASCAVPGGGDASRPSAPGSAFPLDLDRQLAETERDLILRALEETGGVQVKAAELLNISERSMWHRIKKLGINITTVAASELYESLQRGVIDGGEFSTPCSDDSLKLQEVAKYWCSPAWYQSGGVNGVMINKDAWNQLPEEYQNAIQMAAEICTSEQLSRYLWMDFDSTKKMLEEDGCVVTKMNQDDWNTIRETCRQVYEEEAAKNENFNMVYSSMQDYREHADTYRAMLGDYGWGFNYDESEK